MAPITIEQKAAKAQEKQEAAKREEERRAALTPEQRAEEDSTKEQVSKDDIVEVKREDFDKLMKQLAKQSEDIALLYKTTDKSRLAQELNKQGENLIKQCRVSTWDDTGRIIIASKLITNKCEVIMGKWYEDQTISFIMEDGETKIVPYIEYVRKTIHKIPADIISRTDELDERKEKVTIFKLQFPTGKTIHINSAFVN